MGGYGGGFVAGLLGEYGDRLHKDEERQFQERLANKRFALETLSNLAQSPNMRPEGFEVALKALGDAAGVSTTGRGAKNVDLQSLIAPLLESEPPMPGGTLQIPGMPRVTSSVPSPEGGEDIQLDQPIRGQAGPAQQMEYAPTPARPKYFYQPGEREGIVDRARSQGEEELLQSRTQIAERQKRQQMAQVMASIPPGPARDAALYRLMTGANVPESLYRQETPSVRMVSPDGKGYQIVTPTQAQALAQAGWRQSQDVRPPTAADKTLDMEVAGYQAENSGVDEPTARGAVLQRREQRASMAALVQAATLRNLNSLIAERGKVKEGDTAAARATQARYFMGLKKAAETEAQKLLAPYTEQNDSFKKLNKREPTQQDAEEFQDTILSEWTGGMLPQQVDQIIQRGITSGPLGVEPMPSPDMRRGGGGGANWRPRQ